MFDKKTRFLVVDDFGHTRGLIRAFLGELGYSAIEEASDGQIALEKLEKAHEGGQAYGFVISDWNMPKMTGLALLKACRASDKFKTLPFIIVTVESEKQFVMKAIEEGVSDFVIKPFNALTLKEKIQKVYQRINTA